jgi:hypothetical protein
VAVWYPDIQQFGLDQQLLHVGPPNPWRLLWANRLVCSSAIRRDVFEAVRYNEQMRLGYEDWEFYVHACSEQGFVAERLRKPVFRYRRWGYSMVLGTERVRPAVIAQLQAERPIFRDPTRLLALKRRWAPYFGIAARSSLLASPLERQTLQDFRLIDESDAVLRTQSLAVAHPALPRLLVSFDDAALARQLNTDEWLLEKLARALEHTSSPLVWLVSTAEGWRLTGEALATADAGTRVIGMALRARAFFERRRIPATDAGLLVDLASWAQAGGTPATYIVAGTHGAAESPGMPACAPAPETRLRVIDLGRNASHLVKALVGPALHEALWRSSLLLGVQRFLDRGRGPADGPIPVDDGRFREGLVAGTIDAPTLGDVAVALDEPMRLDLRAASADLLVAVEDGTRVGREAEGAWVAVQAGRPQGVAVRGVFLLSLFDGEDPALAHLVGRLRPGRLLLTSTAMLDALPRMRELHPGISIEVKLADALSAQDRERLARTFNLVNRFVVANDQLVDELRALYVSPTRIAK